jgi:inner membrane protein
MPTILTHPAVPLAMALALGRDLVSKRLLAAGILVSIVPDLDVLGFRLGIPYAAELGHRGFSHSLLFAYIVALFGAFLFRTLHSTFHRTLWFLFAAMASHSLLDSFTNGGLGVALLWPWSDQRFFSPVRVIEVSPINPASFMSHRGAKVLWSELTWVWLPFMGIASMFVATRYLGLKLQNARR